MAEWPWGYKSTSRDIVHDKLSYAIYHLCLIWKESTQNRMRYRAETRTHGRVDGRTGWFRMPPYFIARVWIFSYLLPILHCVKNCSAEIYHVTCRKQQQPLLRNPGEPYINSCSAGHATSTVISKICLSSDCPIWCWHLTSLTTTNTGVYLRTTEMIQFDV